jgi:putative ABC transport system substrate-binding protein
MISRRRLLASAAAILGAPLSTRAQSPTKSFRIGVLSPGARQLGPLEAFKDGLRERGYVDGKNITIEWRFADGRNDVLRPLARDLVRLKVDVIVAINTQTALAVKEATTTIPIVFVRGADPVRSGLVQSLGQPGGNVTGISALTDELGGKRLQLLKEALPGVNRVAVLWNGGNPGAGIVAGDLQAASASVGVQLLSHSVQTPNDLRSAFDAGARWRAGAILVIDDVMITTHKALIVDLANKQRVPVMSLYQEFVEVGALLAYGPNIPAIYRRAAYFVDRLLNGAKPQELPVEQPSKLDLVINVSAAKVLGIPVPSTLLLRADRLIE